jgi:hypothetical protein
MLYVYQEVTTSRVVEAECLQCDRLVQQITTQQKEEHWSHLNLCSPKHMERSEEHL